MTKAKWDSEKWNGRTMNIKNRSRWKCANPCQRAMQTTSTLTLKKVFIIDLKTVNT